MPNWKQYVLVGSSLSAIAVAVLARKMSPSMSRLATMFAMELQGIPLVDSEPPATKTKSAIRIGILGAANIAPPAVIWPAFRMENVIIAAVAARDPTKAQRYADKFQIPQVHDTYQDLIEDPTLDAIYNPLPNGYHAYWTIQALKHGKHVLCEKPFASNAQEAELMKQEAENRNLLLVEAFHYRFHPMIGRLKELVQEHIPDIQHIQVAFEIPFYTFSKDDVRFNNRGKYPDLAGGTLMDAGCYTINFVRHIMGDEPTSVKEATTKENFPGVDGRTDATLEFSNNATASIVASFQSWFPLISADIYGKNGRRIYVYNFLVPFVYNRIDIFDEHNKLINTEKVYRDKDKSPYISTYEFQLKAFVDAVQGHPAALEKIQASGSANEAVQNMKVIDMIYKAAGLEPRRGLSVS